MLSPTQEKLEDLVHDAIDKVRLTQTSLTMKGMYDTAQFFASQLVHTSGRVDSTVDSPTRQR